jgi:hypothetical protein
MDFIERLFGISPDGGSGALELCFFLVPMVALCALLRIGKVRLRRKPWRRANQADELRSFMLSEAMSSQVRLPTGTENTRRHSSDDQSTGRPRHTLLSFCWRRCFAAF